MNRSHARLFILLITVLTAGDVLYFAWGYYSVNRGPRLEGAYLITSFGLDGIVIRSDAVGKPAVTVPPLGAGEMRIERKGEGYALFSTEGRYYSI